MKFLRLEHFRNYYTTMRWQRSRVAAWIGYRKDAANGHREARRQFEERLGYTPDFDNPRTHNERVWVRKLFDHDPRFRLLTDKGTARIVIGDTLGKEASIELMMPCLAHVNYFSQLPVHIWNQDIIIKCAHGSGMNHVVKAGDAIAREKASKKIRRWLRKVHGAKKFEWCYFDLKPSLIVEPLLDKDNLVDLKLYFYDETLRFIETEDNSGPTRGTSMYTPDWSQLPMSWPNFGTAEFARPKLLDEIVDVASPLAQGFDMVRVDFLLTESRFYLGELTFYDGSGVVKFDSYENDLAFGRYWRQPHLGFDGGVPERRPS